MERVLRQQFEKVPRQTTVVYEWSSPEGQAFWQTVSRAVEQGVDLDRIGVMLRLSSIGVRYAAQGRKK